MERKHIFAVCSHSATQPVVLALLNFWYSLYYWPAQREHLFPCVILFKLTSSIMAMIKLDIFVVIAAVYFIPTLVLCNTTTAEAKPTDYHVAEDGVRDLLQRQFDEKVSN